MIISEEEQEDIDQLRKDILKSRSQENKLQSWIDNLYENKIIYRESFVILAELDNIRINQERFSANLKPISFIQIPRRFTLKKHQHKIQETLNRSWEIGFSLDPALIKNIQFLDEKQQINAYSFTMWTNPSLVQKVELLVKNGELQEVMNLIN